MASRSVKNERARGALDRRLAPLRSVIGAELARPSGGWIRAIRESLGMSTQDLAARLGVAGSTVVRFERSEQAGKIQLSTLERVAEELDCDLVYALVPRRPLEEAVEDRARELAKRELISLNHTMNLEAQGLNAARVSERIDLLTEHFKSTPGLWRVPEDGR